MDNYKLPRQVTCLVCKKKLKMLCAGEPPSFGFNVDGGIFLTSRGNYGSVEYDPMSESEKISAFLCDECLVGNAGIIIRSRETPRDPVVYIEEFSKYKKRLKAIKRRRQR